MEEKGEAVKGGRLRNAEKKGIVQVQRGQDVSEHNQDPAIDEGYAYRFMAYVLVLESCLGMEVVLYLNSLSSPP